MKYYRFFFINTYFLWAYQWLIKIWTLTLVAHSKHISCKYMKRLYVNLKLSSEMGNFETQRGKDVRIYAIDLFWRWCFPTKYSENHLQFLIIFNQILIIYMHIFRVTSVFMTLLCMKVRIIHFTHFIIIFLTIM